MIIDIHKNTALKTVICDFLETYINISTRSTLRVFSRKTGPKTVPCVALWIVLLLKTGAVCGIRFPFWCFSTVTAFKPLFAVWGIRIRKYNTLSFFVLFQMMDNLFHDSIWLIGIYVYPKVSLPRFVK